MKTSDTVASSILKYLLHLISVALFYGLTYYFTFSTWIHFLLFKFATVPYVTAGNFHFQVMILLIIYSLFCYFANNFILGLYKSGRARQLLTSYFIDFLILQLSMTIMILYNNRFHKTVLDTSMYNVYVITVLLVTKELIAARLLSKKPASAAKKQAG
jgi:hypothetical protein